MSDSTFTTGQLAKLHEVEVARLKRGLPGLREPLQAFIREQTPSGSTQSPITTPAFSHGPFVIPVTYKVPTFEELDAEFDWVDPDYRVIRFKPIKLCRGVSRVPRNITVEYVHVGKAVSNEEALDAIRDRGLRPLIYQEGIALGHHRPDDQRKCPLPILGSVARVGGGPHVAVLRGNWHDDRHRGLGLHPVTDRWGASCVFPGVRE